MPKTNKPPTPGVRDHMKSRVSDNHSKTGQSGKGLTTKRIPNVTRNKLTAKKTTADHQKSLK